MRIRFRLPRWLLTAALCVVLGAGPAVGEECDGSGATSTWEIIENTIFEKYSCSNQICHGTVASGGLDLRPGVAYDNMIDRFSETVDDIRIVFPGEKDRSLLWLNLAAKTYPDQFRAPLRAMPADPIPAMSEDDLEIIRMWIEAGAPETGTVPGTESLDPCLPAPIPVPVRPLPPPPPGEGFQLHMPPRPLPAQRESEVCYATYYDVTDQVPEEFRGPRGDTVRFRRNSIRQDNTSHHLIVNLYQGTAPLSDPRWGAWRCRGGEREGQSCDPTDKDFCGAGAGCASPIVSGVACIGYGPPDAGTGLMSAGISGVQEAAGTFEFAPGVYREMPLKGIILWNSHAFNLSPVEAKVEAWLNFEFAPPDQQQAEALQIFNAEEIFSMNVPPFQTQEFCHIHRLPQRAQLFEISSHMHQRGKRWRTFRGAFRCEDGPNRGNACSPFGTDFASPEHCPDSRCVSTVRVRAGDCNLDGQVTVDEVITGVNIALGAAPMSACYDADRDDDQQVAVDEVINAITAALQGVPPPEERDPDESLMYISFIYNDPVFIRYEPALVFPGPGSTPDERAMTFCALYDNGFTNPNEVKRASTSPPTPINFPGIGGPCSQPTHCTDGKVGEPCTGRGQAARDASCDTAPGAGDGMCDACPLTGGVTTEDEMLLFLGQYFVR